MDQVNIKATFRDDDIFGRKEYAQMAMQLVSQHPPERGACSIAVDAPWGMGKSTFLHMWINELDLGNPNFVAAQDMDPPYESMFAGKCILPVYYNAWENDFCDNALVPLLFTLCAQMEKKNQEGHFLADQNEKIVDFISACAQLLTSLTLTQITKDSTAADAGGAVAGLATKGILRSLNRYLEKKAQIEPDETISAEYDKQLLTRQKFRETLEELATNSDGVYIFIDELDRCKPSFAVETLEVIKHFLNIPNVSFVFAVDQMQLCHAIAGRYGNDMDTGGYLAKFFDYQIRMPAPTAAQMIQNSLSFIPHFDHLLLKSLQDLFNVCNISPREIPIILKQAYTIWNVHFSNPISKKYNSSSPYLCVLSLLCMKVKKPMMYDQYMSHMRPWKNDAWETKAQTTYALLLALSSKFDDTAQDVCNEMRIEIGSHYFDQRDENDKAFVHMCYLLSLSIPRQLPFKAAIHNMIEFVLPITKSI